MRIAVRTLLLAAALFVAGCGNPDSFPNELRDVAGEQIHVTDIEAIMDDPALTDEQKREKLMAMGILDEDVLDWIFVTF
jgi:hypothetical protein